MKTGQVRHATFSLQWPGRPLLLAIFGFVAVLLAASPSDLPAFAQSAGWIATFDGKPTSPVPFNPTNWDVQVHSRNVDTWKHLEPMQAHHGSNCSGYPGTHPISE